MKDKKPIGVLIVDDSASVRQILSAILAEDPGVTVIGAVADPFAAAPMPRDDEPGREARVRSFADAIADGMARARDERVRELATQRMMDPARGASPAGR